MYYEYIGFNKVSKSLKPKLWLSLHDMSPIVTAERKAVYCHNSTPFYHVKLNQIRYSYKLYLFSVFYKYIYRINIKSNTYVIVQQQWLRNAFAEMYKLDKHKIIVSYPCELPQEKSLRCISLHCRLCSFSHLYQDLLKILKLYAKQQIC